MGLVGFGSTDRRTSCGCSGRSMSGFGAGPDGLGAGPDGLGSSGTPLISGTVSGSQLFDAVIGAGLGFAMSPSWKTDMLYTVGAAAAMGLIGLPGLLGVVAVGAFSKSSQRK